MGAFSTMRTASSAALNLAKAVLRKNVSAPVLSGQVRNGHSFEVTASRWQWTKTKDMIHFYAMLGIIPLGAAVTYLNVTEGPAKLSEIHEGYHPEEYEYYESPVTRFLVKHFATSYQQQYERTLHYLYRHAEKKMLDKTQNLVMEVMMERGDYKAYYYRPVLAKYYRQSREDAEYLKFIRGEQ